MSNQPSSAGGILSREWRMLKPMPWLLMAGAAAILLSTWVLPALRTEKPPAPLVIHRSEKLTPAEIDFEVLKEIPGADDKSPGVFRPLVAYRVAPKDAKSFSHAFTLNFQGDSISGVWKHPGKPALASLADGKWAVSTIRLEDKTAGGARYFAAELSAPGTFALGYVVPAPTASTPKAPGPGWEWRLAAC